MTSSAPASVAPIDQTFPMVGGTAAFRFSPEGVTLLYAVPNPGYQAEVEPEGTGMKAEFEGAGGKYRVDVWWADGPQHEIRVDND